MKQTAVEWLVDEMIQRKFFEKETELSYTTLEHLTNQAKEMEKQKNISLVEWIRENTVEVQDGWQYLGELYTDKQIIEIYNTLNLLLTL